ncbi:MAG: NADH-ubiquinone oxidoreductase-F iron-sulfur binding region domain-containing protein [Tissierella sp.]|uniref:NADH-ubiquinone oxidoreductase-F iron-sulfur binding region domain-containing protein n=1 Tax=Tissierella sp. TaxID=41274 RepID=UPI003F9C920D
MIALDMLEEIKERNRKALEDRLTEKGGYIIDEEGIRLKGDYFEKQVRIALKNCDIIDPTNIEEYIAMDGYFSLRNILNNMTPKEVIDIVKDSGLRGRGGAGFPSGIKWDTAYGHKSDKKYVVCNADEGDPGAFMDRSILEKDPHSVLEAMAITGYAIGSDQGFIYVRAEYPVAVTRLKEAIEKAKEYGVLGQGIFGSDFNFDIELRLGAGAFVCGEGTALIESIEGKRGMPRTKIYRTAHKGLWQQPTIINNVETFANVPVIFQRGVDWFTSIGTEKSPGTKVFALVGKVETAGLVEVPMGMPLREIIYDIGGGIPDGKKFKSVQTGGPSGGCIPEHLIDTPVDFESLASIGSIMGSGGMVVMDETDCMVDIAKFFLDFTVDESCGKCVPCREGTKRMYELLEKITSGNGKKEDIDTMEKLSVTISSASLCGLGQTASNPVVSTLKYFRDEYEAHILDKKCPAGSCQELLEYFITDKCIGCGQCKKVCPVSCISGERKALHIIDQDICISCGACQEKCPVDAIIRS